jgi:hypothetical protein
MLRAPGESISDSIKKRNDDLNSYYIIISITPPLCFSMYLTTHYIGGYKTSITIYLFIALIFVTFFVSRLLRVMKQLHNEYLGLDCERSVGQELNLLLLDGCRVYHDFQADGFNIDHIVIAENGVFAIETKGRAKPDRGKGQDDAKVVYDGNSLQFPTWNERQPLEQAKRQAEWLGNWLTSAVGAQVSVKPALALPGWYVERKKGDFLIYNGKNPKFLLSIRAESGLSPDMVQRISHQIEQRCRDVEPLAYKKKTK